MKAKRSKTIGEVFVGGTLIDLALGQAVQDAVEKHRKAGQPLAVWKGGKTAWVQPEDVEGQDGNRTEVRRARKRTTRSRG